MFVLTAPTQGRGRAGDSQVSHAPRGLSGITSSVAGLRFQLGMDQSGRFRWTKNTSQAPKLSELKTFIYSFDKHTTDFHLQLLILGKKQQVDGSASTGLKLQTQVALLGCGRPASGPSPGRPGSTSGTAGTRSQSRTRSPGRRKGK